MRTDAELLQRFINDAPTVRDRVTGQTVTLCVKVLSDWTGKAGRTIYEYANGERNIPVEFWRAFMEHCPDTRIISLILPPGLRADVIDVTPGGPETPAAFLRDACKSIEQHAGLQKYLAEILADGRIDELDKTSVQRYAEGFHAHRRTEAQLFQAIVNKYNDCIAANHGGNG